MRCAAFILLALADGGLLAADAGPSQQPAEAVGPSDPRWRFEANSGGMELRSPEGNFQARLRGYVQFDSRVFPANDVSHDALLLRRLRPIVEGSVFEKIDYRLMLDFAPGVIPVRGNNGYVQDAYVNVRFRPEFQVQAGKFHTPVGLERLQSDANLTFIERAYPSQLVPNRDLGAEIHGEVREGEAAWELGIFSGQPDGTTGDADQDSGKDAVARLFLQPWRNSGGEAVRRLGFGVGGALGDHAGPLAGYKTPGQRTFFDYYRIPGGGANVESDGLVWRVAPQAYYYYGPLGLMAEYAISSSEARRTGGAVTGDQTAALTHTAWQLAFSYVLTGEENSFAAIIPRHPISTTSRGPGAWQFAARVTGISLDERALPLYADPARRATDAISFTVGLNWYWNRNLRLAVNYEHTDFDSPVAKRSFPGSEEAVLSRLQVRW